jgi:hypothetical protein
MIRAILMVLTLALALPAAAQLADDPNDATKRMLEQSRQVEVERTQRELERFCQRNQEIDAAARGRNEERRRLDERERRQQREIPPSSGPKPGAAE